MSTAIATPKIVFHRFAWKEYRMLRGFWLAVLVLAVLEQWISTLMLDAGPIVPGWMFASAWGAAALYAVGAAVTLFSAENEERTREFLQTLPTQWLPMFLAKVSLAVGSALLLAGGLCLTGWIIAGQMWPSTADWQLALSVGSVAVLEATVWGLLFSLLWRQPLLAAVAALAAASIGAQLAIGFTPNVRNAFTVQSYDEATLARLLLCLGVFALDVVISRRWLAPRFVGKRKLQKKEAPLDLAVQSAAPAAELATATPPRRRMLARLLWQTWRESWKPLLAVIPLAVFLMVASLIPFGLMMDASHSNLPIHVSVILFLPALLGAMVFRADQKKDHRLFLTAHAARPRFVWLTRHMVWLGTTLLIAAVVHLFIAVAVGREVSDGLMRYLRGEWGYDRGLFGVDRRIYSNWMKALEHKFTETFLARATALGWSALFTAYALGQCCSMLLKREVLAGFLALLFSVVLAGWALVIMFWELEPTWFVLPLGVGAMLATWLRAPDWIVGKRRLHTWLLPSLVLVVSLVGMVFALPAARLDQLDLPQPVYPFLTEPLETSLARFDKTRAAGQETALEYERLSAKLSPLFRLDEELTIDGKTYEEWGLYELADAYFGAAGYGGEGAGYGGEGEFEGVSNVPERSITDAEAAFLDEMSERFQEKRDRKHAEISQPIVERLLKLSRRPHCRFPPLFSGTQWRYMQQILVLLHQDGLRLTEAGDLDAALARYCALIRVQSHLLQGQLSTAVTSNQIHAPSFFYGLGYTRVLSWAQHEDQTSERITQAIVRLQESFKHLPHPREAILADWELIRDVLSEKEVPSFMKVKGDHQRASHFLAYLANKFPWERQRALQALDCLTVNSLNYVDAVVHMANGEPYRTRNGKHRRSPRKLIGGIPWHGGYALSEAAFDSNWLYFSRASQLVEQCRTSHLLNQEFDQSGQFFQLLQGWLDAETRRRALVVQLALLAYRLDHEEYPETLAQLTPDYLPEAVLDPFSGGDFRYAAQGFELPVTWKHYAPVEHIPANTPLVWSVGNANFKLQEWQKSDTDASAVVDSELVEQLEAGRSVLGFWRTEHFTHGRRNQVFPLPQ